MGLKKLNKLYSNLQKPAHCIFTENLKLPDSLTWACCWAAILALMPDRSVATAIHWVTPCRICRVRRLSKACVILSFFLFLSVMYPNQATRIYASTFTFLHKISLNSNIVPALYYTLYMQY